MSPAVAAGAPDRIFPDESRRLQGRGHRGIEPGLLHQEPDGNQAQEQQDTIAGQPLGCTYFFDLALSHEIIKSIC